MGQLHDLTAIELTDEAKARLKPEEMDEYLAGAVLAIKACKEHVIRGTKLDTKLDQALEHVQGVRHLLYPPEQLVMPSVSVYQEFTRVEPVPGSLAEAALGCMRPPVESTLVVPALFGDRNPYANTRGPIIGLPQEGCQGAVGNSCDISPAVPMGHSEYNVGDPGFGVPEHLPQQGVGAAELFAAIKKHHADRGNDRCWENDKALYVAAGLEPGDPQLPPLDEHCRNCAIYRKGLYGKAVPDQPWIAIRLLTGTTVYTKDEGPESLYSFDPVEAPAIVLSLHKIRTKPRPNLIPSEADCDWIFLDDSESDLTFDDSWKFIDNALEILELTPTMADELRLLKDLLVRQDRVALLERYWRTDAIVC